MRRLPLLLLALALPAAAQTDEGVDAGTVEAADAGLAQPEAADAGTLEAVDAGLPLPAPLGIPPGVGRHFAFTWDTEGPAPGEPDVQLWITPRWGRVEQYMAVDVRAGARLGLPRGFSLGFFLDVTPTSSGVTMNPSIDARGTVHVHKGGTLAGPLRWAAQVEVSGGATGFSVAPLLALDTQLGALRVGLNADAWTDVVFPGGTRLDKTRARQTLGISYTLTNGFSAGLELQNRLTWRRDVYFGDAFCMGPSVAYRGENLWFAIAMLPQIAAMKAEAQRGVGDPLELLENERFTVRVSLGVVAR